MSDRPNTDPPSRRSRRRLRRQANRLPAGVTDDPPDTPPGDPRRRYGGPSTGGAGVREPRRPKPDLPSMAAEAPEPVDQFVDLAPDRA